MVNNSLRDRLAGSGQNFVPAQSNNDDTISAIGQVSPPSNTVQTSPADLSETTHHSSVAFQAPPPVSPTTSSPNYTFPDNQPESSQDQSASQQQPPQPGYDPRLDRLTDEELAALAVQQQQPIKEEIYLTWQAPSRPFQPKSRGAFTTVFTIAALLSLIFVFVGQAVLVAVVFAVVFLWYVLATVPPQDITLKISNYGLRVENELYFWDEMGRYWFEPQRDQVVVKIETIRFPYRLVLVTGDIEDDLLDAILNEMLIKEKPPETLFERGANWLQQKLPLDTM